jgi:hypothetical protein
VSNSVVQTAKRADYLELLVCSEMPDPVYRSWSIGRLGSVQLGTSRVGEME